MPNELIFTGFYMSPSVINLRDADSILIEPFYIYCYLTGEIESSAVGCALFFAIATASEVTRLRTC